MAKASDSTTRLTALICMLLAWCPAAGGAPRGGKGPEKPAPLPALTGTSVSIPWKELQGLLAAARRPGPARPPVEYVLSPAEYAATVSGDVAKVTARCEVNVLADTWALVALGPAPAGLRNVTLDGASCPVVMQDGTLHALLSGRGRKKLQLVLEENVAPDKGGGRFELALIPSPIVTVTTTIPRTGLEVTAGVSAGVRATEKAGRTTAVSSHRGGATATIRWRARPVRPEALPTRLYAEAETLIRLDDGLARSAATLRLQVVHTPLETLRLNVDAKAAVLSVSGDGVAGWRFADVKGAKAVEVTFAPPAAGEKTVTVIAERDLPEAGGEVAFQAIGVPGAKRDRGSVAVAARGRWEVKPGKGDSAERIGTSELPASLRAAAGKGLELAYRYARTPATVSLAVGRPKAPPAKLYAATATLATVERGRIRCRANVSYQVLHAGVDTFRVSLPAGVDLLGVAGANVRHTQVLTEGKKRTLVVDLKDLARGGQELIVTYDRPLKDDEKSPVVPLLAHPAAAEDRGTVGIEVRGGLEVRAAAKGAERVDVKELSGTLWNAARSPLLMGFRYARAPAEITLGLTRHEDVDVLVAMSDVCEAATTITPDGKGVTKMMYVLRNNRKQFMALSLPAGAEVWSAFVNDRPVTPVRAGAGKVLVPLVKSAEEDDDEDDGRDSYVERRDRRRREGPSGEARLRERVERLEKLRKRDEAPRDLKPYDVEIVFVTPKLAIAERGEVKLALPACDIPTGQMAWAVFVPAPLRVVHAEGNLKEVGAFSLPFRHFAEAELARRSARVLAKAEAMQQARQLAKVQDALKALAPDAKARGVLPVRIEIPVTGQISRFEKLLVVDEAPEVTLTYRRKVD